MPSHDTNVSRPRSQRQPDTKFPCPSAHRKRQNTRNSDDGDRQRNRGEHAKHDRVQTVRRKHLGANVFERGRMLYRLFNRHPANNTRNRRHQRIRISTRVDKQASAEKRPLCNRVIDGLRGLRNNVQIVYIGSNADDAMRLDLNSWNKFQDRIRPIHVSVDRILIGEHLLGKRLTDDNHRVIRFAVKVIKITSRNDRNPERSKKTRRDDAQLGVRIFARARNMPITGKLQAYAARAVAPGYDHAKCRALHARQRINAANGFLIKVDHLLIGLAERHRRDVNREDVTHVQPRLGPLQLDQRCDQHACARQ